MRLFVLNVLSALLFSTTTTHNGGGGSVFALAVSGGSNGSPFQRAIIRGGGATATATTLPRTTTTHPKTELNVASSIDILTSRSAGIYNNNNNGDSLSSINDAKKKVTDKNTTTIFLLLRFFVAVVVVRFISFLGSEQIFVLTLAFILINFTVFPFNAKLGRRTTTDAYIIFIGRYRWWPSSQCRSISETGTFFKDTKSVVLWSHVRQSSGILYGAMRCNAMRCNAMQCDKLGTQKRLIMNKKAHTHS